MQACPTCKTALVDDAQFCHTCGKALHKQEACICPKCSTSNPSNFNFCLSCGESLEQKSVNLPVVYVSEYEVNFKDKDALEDQLKMVFFQTLKQSIKEESGLKKYPDYIEAIYKSGFHRHFEATIMALIKDLRKPVKKKDVNVSKEADIKIKIAFEGLIDQLCIQYARELAPIKWPMSILNYEKARLETTNIEDLISDYLDLENENEQYYTDFLEIPKKKIQNACKAFLFAEPEETLLFVLDLTLFGSCKEGIAMTDEAMYWKSHFNKAYKVEYHSIKELSHKGSWLSINDHYFSINKGMDFKIHKLFKKIQLLYKLEEISKA